MARPAPKVAGLPKLAPRMVKLGAASPIKVQLGWIDVTRRVMRQYSPFLSGGGLSRTQTALRAAIARPKFLSVKYSLS